MHSVLFIYICTHNESQADPINKTSPYLGVVARYPKWRASFHTSPMLTINGPISSQATSSPLALISPLAQWPCPSDIPFITTKRLHQHYGAAFQSGTYTGVLHDRSALILICIYQVLLINHLSMSDTFLPSLPEFRLT
jgi:hypothetical protein